MSTITLNTPIQIDDLNSLEYLSSVGCVSLQHTNVRMSGNHKLVYHTDNNVYLESISSDEYLAKNTFKKYAVNMNESYRHNLYNFFNQTDDNESIWTVNMIESAKSSTFSTQYPTLYKWGAYSEIDDQIHDGYRFFAPIWTYGKLPDRFLIFRVYNQEFTSIRDYINYGTLVKNVSLTSDTNIGAYLHSFTEESSFKDYCIFTNFADSFIRYYGIDVNSGKYVYNTESTMDSYLANERTVTEFNNALTNGWERGGLLCPNIINLEFVFDDYSASEGFNNYVGFYCYDNEIEKTEADILQSQNGVLVLNYNSDESVIYKENAAGSLTSLSTTNETITTTSTPQLTKTELSPLIEISLMFKPVPGTVFAIEYNNKRYIEIYMMNEYVTTDTNIQVLYMINDVINSTLTDDIVISSSIIDEKLVIKSNITDIEYENITAVLPPAFTVSSTTYFNSEETEQCGMHMISYNDIFINANTVSADATIAEIDGVEYSIEKTFSYLGYNIMRLDDSFSDVRTLSSSVITLKKVVDSKYNVLSYVKHVDFDMSMLTTPYTDVYDYDMSTYQMKVGEQIHEVFEHHYNDSLTESDIDILDSYISYFMISVTDYSELYYMVGDVAYPVANSSLEGKPRTDVLINSIDDVSSQPTLGCTNEYDRLSETTLSQIKNVNLTEPLIAKFACVYGNDSCNNPISLNLDITHRQDNFINILTNTTSVNNNTFSWFIMGAGPGPISSDGTFTPYLNNISKQLGYANTPTNTDSTYKSITVNLSDGIYDLTDTTFDVYDLLKYRVVKNVDDKEYFEYEAYSWLYPVEGESNVYNGIFRGVEWSFNGAFDGYKFAVILVTECDINKTGEVTEPYILVDNQVFKTLTLVVNEFIPDNILTVTGNSYYLDRSYLYYANQYYTSSDLSYNLNEDYTTDVSLSLFDTEQTKSYLNTTQNIEFNDPIRNVTSVRNSWYSVDSSGNPIFYISKASIDNYTFSELVTTKDNVKIFEWVHTTQIYDDTLSIIVKYTAFDIIEVGNTHIWCKDIFIEFLVNGVYLQEYNNMGSLVGINLTMANIILNNQPTYTINNCTYYIPFWDKISSSQYMTLPISDDDGNFTRSGLRITKEFYEEVDSRYTYPEVFQPFMRTTDTGKTFITFDTVVHDHDTTYVQQYRNDLTNRSGYIMEHDQYWFILKDFAKDGAAFLNYTIINPEHNSLKLNKLDLILNENDIDTYIVTATDITKTTKAVTIVPPDETYLLASLGYDSDDNTLYRLDSYITQKIYRTSNYYAPQFKRILQPQNIIISNYIHIVDDIDDITSISVLNRHVGQYIYSKTPKLINSTFYNTFKFVGSITNTSEVSQLEKYIVAYDTIDEVLASTRHIGDTYYISEDNQIYSFVTGITDSELVPQTITDNYYTDVVMPDTLIPTYSGRTICTNVDNLDDYTEEYLDTHMNHIFNHYFYTAQYDGISYDVVGDAVLCEQRDFISTLYFNSTSIDMTTSFISNTVDLVEVCRNKLGSAILYKYIYNYDSVSLTDMLYAMKLYNIELNSNNIVFENLYYNLFERFYYEWFSKHYIVTGVKTNSDSTKMDFTYTDEATLSISESDISSSTGITITFTKI